MPGANVELIALDCTNPQYARKKECLWATTTTNPPSTTLPATTTTAAATTTTAPPVSTPTTVPPSTRRLSGEHRVAELTVGPGEVLEFDPGASTTLVSSGNVAIRGVLRMRPTNPEVIHTLRFEGVDEAVFVGGGLDPIPSDVGLWVVDDGQLDVVGTPKTAWTRLDGSASAGATELTLATAPAGWRPGDELFVAPTEPPGVGSRAWTGFDELGMTSVSGRSIAVSSPLLFAHPFVAGAWSAEVGNLTRNVRIEGTPNGRSHVFLRSSRPQTISHAALRWMGPRRNGEKVLGRWPIHFHHGFDGARGSLIEGTVVRDAGSHAFVPHAVSGVTFRDIVGYNLTETGFWWDGNRDQPEPPANEILVERALLAKVRSDDPNSAAFSLKHGAGNAVVDSVAVGMIGNGRSSGFDWPTGEVPLWRFERNVAHNNLDYGIRFWTNDTVPHLVKDFAGYHNGGSGVFLGAYANSADFEDVRLHGNRFAGVELAAVSKPEPITFTRLEISNSLSAIVTVEHQASVEFDRTATVIGCSRLAGILGPPIVLASSGHPDVLDVHDCGLSATAVDVVGAISGTRIRHFTAGTLDWEVRR